MAGETTKKRVQGLGRKKAKWRVEKERARRRGPVAIPLSFGLRLVRKKEQEEDNGAERVKGDMPFCGLPSVGCCKGAGCGEHSVTAAFHLSRPRSLTPSLPPRPSSSLQFWRYEGSKTLSYYLKRRDTISALAEELGVSEEAAVPTVMKHLFASLGVRAGGRSRGT